MVDEVKPEMDQTMPSPKKEVGESKSADKRRKSGSGSSGGEKGISALRVRGSKSSFVLCLFYDHVYFVAGQKSWGAGK